METQTTSKINYLENFTGKLLDINFKFSRNNEIFNIKGNLEGISQNNELILDSFPEGIPLTGKIMGVLNISSENKLIYQNKEVKNKYQDRKTVSLEEQTKIFEHGQFYLPR